MLADAAKQFAFADLEESSKSNEADLSLCTPVLLLSVRSDVSE